MSNFVTAAHKKQVTTQVAVKQTRQFLTFLLEQDLFGVDILDVKEILEIIPITAIPLTPSYIRGVINLRGQVVPIIDLTARLERGTCAIGKHSCIILVTVKAPAPDEQNSEQHILGLLVDRVNEIMELAEENILPAPDFGAEIRTEFIQAMGRVEDVFVILLALNRVLSAAELSQLQKSVTAPASSME